MVKGVVMAMWTRSELKERGKAALHRNYWITVLVTLIIGVLTGDFLNSSGNTARSGTDNFDAVKSVLSIIPLMRLILILVPIFLIGILFAIFVSNAFEVGSCRFFEENSVHKARLGLILDGFKDGTYLSNVNTMFFRALYTFLWSLCLIIPGIVKSYEYKMIPYILAENPMITRKRAFELSKQMMDGQKGDAFVLDLSFIGWNILSTITLGIVGVLYVSPYINTTWVEFYKVNREMALENGMATVEELPGLQKEADE